jgi:DNA-binding GntR family transcriptional regulator
VTALAATSAVRGSGPETTQQHAVQWLRRAIVTGELRPGDRIPQDEIAERIGVSLIPVREALRALESEGQVRYFPRRGYFVTELRIADLEEIYTLRRRLEEGAVRRALPDLDLRQIEEMSAAARECTEAAAAGDVARELQANRRFHFALFAHPEQPHTLRLIRLLWDSTEPYRALYYNSPRERAAAGVAHRRILRAAKARDADRLVTELDRHRERALRTLRAILAPDDERATA